MKSSDKEIEPIEDEEAFKLALFLEDLKYAGKIALFSHVAQETFTRDWGTKMKNKRKGVKKGVPDYIIVTEKEILFIELKRLTLGTVSIEQKEWLTLLPGKTARTFVAKGWKEARRYILTTLDQPLTNS